MRFRNINLINPSAANLNKIGTTSANAIRGIGAIKTSTVKTAESIKAIPGQVRDAPARLRAWVDKLKNPKIKSYDGDIIKLENEIDKLQGEIKRLEKLLKDPLSDFR